jgi:hypothetical protein
MIGAPRNATIKLRQGDRLVTPNGDGGYYQIVGPRKFDYPSSVNGWNHKYYWMTALMTV